jgi:hypothetical protein
MAPALFAVEEMFEGVLQLFALACVSPVPKEGDETNTRKEDGKQDEKGDE